MKQNEIMTCSEMIINTFENIEKSKIERNNKFFNAWKNVITKINNCGQNLYEHSTVVDIKNGILLVETDHPGLSQLMQMNTKFILRGLKMYIPEMNIVQLAFRIKGSNATLCSVNYEESFSKANKDEFEKLNRQEIQLKEYDKKYENKSVHNENDMPLELLNKFESIKRSMLTKK